MDGEDEEEGTGTERAAGGNAVRRHAAAPFSDGDRIVERPRACFHAA